MKLKTILTLLQETYGTVSMGNGSFSSNDTKLRPMPGSTDDVDDWDGIKEGDGWFMYREANNWDKRRAGASVYITEEDTPHKYWIKVKTHRLRKPKDTNKIYQERVKKHTDKIARAWVNEARRIYKEAGYSDVGNKITIPWKQAFKEALNSPKIRDFIENWGEESVAPMVDPVNFTPRK